MVGIVDTVSTKCDHNQNMPGSDEMKHNCFYHTAASDKVMDRCLLIVGRE